MVVDFGSQYTHLLTQRIRRLGVYSEIVFPEDTSLASLKKDVKGIVLSGGPMSVYDEDSPKINRDLIESLEIPVLGVCYGHQLLAYLFNGKVIGGDSGEYGKTVLNLSKPHPLTDELPEKSVVWMSHKDKVVSTPEEFDVIAYTNESPVAIMANDNTHIYSVQFHPEVRHTDYGSTILKNYIYKICGCKGGYHPIDVINQFISHNKHLSNEYALVAVSGGIDSTVTALILREIFGEKLFPIFINTGLLRYEEEEWVKSLFSRIGFKNLVYRDASNLFLKRLKNVTDPEEKRRVIADTFIEVFKEIANQLSGRYGSIRYLGQGTLYPDRVESGATGRYTDRIKSHHNVSMSRLMDFRLLEPLKELYKDEVRVIGRKLGLPKELLIRHPFPGPGLAIRIVGEVDEEKLKILKRADRILYEELKRLGLYEVFWQAFPVLLSLKSVGVKGDKRSYEYILVLRIVESVDAMTANFSKLNWDILEDISNKLLNEVDGINRVLYDISNKPPATIEFE